MLRRLVLLAITLILLIGLSGSLFLSFSLRNAHPALRLAQQTLVIRDATIYLSPDEPPLNHADLLVRAGRIATVGPHLELPADARQLPCNHCTITAGFWNAHVHFTQPKWLFSACQPATKLNAQLVDMLTSRGFTTVVDLGSNPLDTISLRRRIETGNLLGPFVYTAGAAQYPPHGLPFYLRRTEPALIQHLSPKPDSPAEAASDEEKNIARGADLLKLFTGSYITPNDILAMPLANAAAAVQVAHTHHQLAFAHPSNLEGVLIARDAGVDVLAHAADTAEGVTPAVLQSLIDRHMAMVPTLKMFGTTVTRKPSYLDPIFAEVHQFHALGGQLLFGTDVGYMTDYTTEDEFTYLERSGLTPMEILRMLTTAPAIRFGVEREKGSLHPGQLADLVLLGSDPATDPNAFSNVLTTIRSGRVLYTRSH